MDGRIIPVGDSAVVLELEPRIDPIINARAIRIREAMLRAGIEGLRDVVSAYRAVTVYFDPLRCNFEHLRNALEKVAAAVAPGEEGARDPVRVPVCYEGECAPDLSEVAEFGQCSVEEVVGLHAAGVYRVYMMGFLPGFAYMGTVHPRIAAPRRATPRLAVPGGMVGIAGPQTGIYPIASPGGWRLVGRTPVRPFDLERPNPFLFKPGDVVQFDPIDLRQFQELSQWRFGSSSRAC